MICEAETHRFAEFDAWERTLATVCDVELYGRHLGRENWDGACELVVDAQPLACNAVKQLIRLGTHMDALDNLKINKFIVINKINDREKLIENR